MPTDTTLDDIEEVRRLLPAAMDMTSHLDLDRSPKMLAIALAVQQILDEEASRVCHLASEHLRIARGPAKERAA